MDINNSSNIKKNDTGIKIFLSIFILASFFIVAVLIIKIKDSDGIIPDIPVSSEKPIIKNTGEFKKFITEQEFKDYLAASSSLNIDNDISFNRQLKFNEAHPTAPMSDAKNSANGMGGDSLPDRISGTNVQVIGIDEPDIVKTNGKEIYFSGTQNFYPMMRGVEDIDGIKGNSEKMIAPYPYPAPQAKTSIIKAFPPANLAIDGKIDKQGDLLLNNNTLIVFPSQKYYYNPVDKNDRQEIAAYDISKTNLKSSVKKWTIKLNENTSIVTSRLKDEKIYLITRNNINLSQPCPIRPLSTNNFSNLKEIIDISIPCAEIYHPIAPTSIDSTFVVSLINPATGKIEKNVSFVGSSGATVIYVSENAIYAAYPYNESIIKFFSGFIRENKSFFPAYLVDKINKLNTYDISENAKITELTALMEKYQNSLNSDDRLKLENEMQNRMSDYYKAHSRELEKTGIVKINTDNLTITAAGAVPGHLLNNFSMDEYQGNLRVASTIGSRWGVFNGIGRGESVSDVTILDKNLDFLGSVKDLGKTEQIYSARFIGDKGYVVTFRQTDPFYILDLANPKNPQMTGELKIPGYSSYLHPLDATHILGIGQEGSQVKISLFDVSDKNNPIELDKYLLDEYWTEVSNNYHAFLLDTEHKIFFLPGSKGGYVFSYTTGFDNTWLCQNRNSDEETDTNFIDKCKNYIDLVKAVSQNSVKRAIYLNDYLYIIGDDKITVLNELDWEKVNELDLK